MPTLQDLSLFFNVLPNLSRNKKYESFCTVKVFEILYLRKLQHGALKKFMSTLCQPYCGFLCSLAGVCRQLPPEPWEAELGSLAAHLRVQVKQ